MSGRRAKAIRATFGGAPYLPLEYRRKKRARPTSGNTGADVRPSLHQVAAGTPRSWLQVRASERELESRRLRGIDLQRKKAAVRRKAEVAAAAPLGEGQSAKHWITLVKDAWREVFGERKRRAA